VEGDDEDGMVKIEVVLPPEEAELVWAMLNHAATQLARGLPGLVSTIPRHRERCW
jgi:hypothetical protein